MKARRERKYETAGRVGGAAPVRGRVRARGCRAGGRAGCGLAPRRRAAPAPARGFRPPLRSPDTRKPRHTTVWAKPSRSGSTV